MIFTIVSPDKLSLSMFTDFFKRNVDGNVSVGEIISLYSQEMQERIMDDFLNRSPETNVLIRYKTKRATKVESIPEKLFNGSDYVVKFDLYSMEPEILKEKQQDLGPLLDKWKQDVEKNNIL